MVIQNIDYPNYLALKRLIQKNDADGSLNDAQLDKIKYLATEHGISKEEVEELLELLEIR